MTAKLIITLANNHPGNAKDGNTRQESNNDANNDGRPRRFVSFMSNPSGLMPALPRRLFCAAELVIGAALLLLLGSALPALMATALNWWLAWGLYGGICLLILLFWPHGALGWANRVTLIRAVVVTLLAGALGGNAFISAVWLWLILALIALALDGLDGWMARHTLSQSPFGARFDMELDALLILLLCVGLLKLESLNAWVLLIGGMRYLFVAAGYRLAWLSAPLFESFRRKAICVWQVVALLLALTPLTSHEASHLLALSALLVSVYSFGVDTAWLYAHRHRQ